MRKFLFVLPATMLATVATLSFAGGAPAGAEARKVDPIQQTTGSGWSACPAGSYCLYNWPLYNESAPSKEMWVGKDTQPALPVGGDQAESVVNRTDDPVTVYEHFGTGHCLTIQPHSSVRDLDAFMLANSVSSVRRGPEFTCPASGYITP